MAKNNKPNTDLDFIDLVPYQKKPYKNNIDCKIKEQLKVDKYNVTIDSDPVDNLLYFELGYDDKEEYNSAFFISPIDAYNLGKELQDRAMKLMEANYLYSSGNNMLSIFKEKLNNNNIKELYILPYKLFTEDIEDTLFGRIIIEIYYKTKTDEIEYFRYLSDPIQKVERNYLYNFTLELEDKDIDTIYIDIDNFEFLWDKIKLIREKWLNRNKKPNNNKTMTPKESLYQSIQNTIDKINESKPSK